MKYKLTLNLSDDTKKIEEQEKLRFMRDVLEMLEVPLDYWKPDQALTLEIKDKLHKEVSRYNIQIIDYSGEELEIFQKRELIAKWSKPLYILKKDYSQIDPKKRVFLEMEVNITSKFLEE